MSTQLFESESLLDEGVALFRNKKYPEAQSTLKQALEKRKAAVGENDPGVAHYLGELGQVCVALGESGQAITHFQQAVAILEKSFYAGHASIAPVLMHIVDVYLSMNKHAEAEPMCLRALEINEKTLSGEHRATLESMVKLANIYMQLGKNADAEKLLTKGMKQVDTPLGPAEEFQFLLAQINEKEGKKEEAVKLYQSACAGYEQRRNYWRLSDCLTRYGEFLRKENRKEEATNALNQAKKFKEFAVCMNPHEDLFSATLLRA
jgi:tetratricopeptide (TPR) repeat protein